MVQIAPGWTLDLDRGPDWLFVRVHPPVEDSLADAPPLADAVWTLLEQHHLHRVVLELDEMPRLFSPLLGQLMLLYKRVYTQGGLLRLSGLSAENQEVLDTARLGERLPTYSNRGEAVMGHRPTQPR
jgi:anti-anti-sigma regulatory factor